MLDCGAEPVSATLPNFFVVGAPKAGTTSLYHYLDQHPEIYMSPVKEPSYFADEIRPENFSDEMLRTVRHDLATLSRYLHGPMTTKRFSGPVTEWDSYLKLFERARGYKAVGEASVCYLWSESAPRNIAARCHQARIIVILRNPTERAFEQYLHVLSLELEPMSFREYIDQSWACKSSRLSKLHPFLEFGRYSEQLRRYFNAFAPEHIRIFLYEDYLGDAAALLREVFRFLSVDERFEPDRSRQYLEATVPRSLALHRFLTCSGIWQCGKNACPASWRRRLRGAVFRPPDSLRMLPQDRALLAAYYRDDVRELAELINRDLSAWLE
jgi:hypothetical protein